MGIFPGKESVMYTGKEVNKQFPALQNLASQLRQAETAQKSVPTTEKTRMSVGERLINRRFLQPTESQLQKGFGVRPYQNSSFETTGD